MIGFLAQAFDEAVPDGTTGMAAAEAIAAFLDKAGYTIVPKDVAPANVDEAKSYLQTGGVEETMWLAYMAFDAGREKIQMDTNMAIALCMLANEALERYGAH